MPQHRAEALKAIGHAIARLESPAPLAGFDRPQLVATLHYAHAEVEAIQEVKRARKAKEIV